MKPEELLTLQAGEPLDGAAKAIIECRVRARPADPHTRASRSATAGTEATARAEWMTFQREVLASPDALEAAPGLTWQTPAAAARHRPHHGGAHAVACIGTKVAGTTWCIEEIAPAPSPPYAMGVWAYDTMQWPSAAERLDERCVFLGTDLWQQLRQAAQQAALEAAAKEKAHRRYERLRLAALLCAESSARHHCRSPHSLK